MTSYKPYSTLTHTLLYRPQRPKTSFEPASKGSGFCAACWKQEADKGCKGKAMSMKNTIIQNSTSKNDVE